MHDWGRVHNWGRVSNIKVGRTSLTPRVRQELARDIKMLRSGQVDSVEWHFSSSPTTGRSGPTAPLRTKLEKFEILIVE